jgi:predicted esterase
VAERYVFVESLPVAHDQPIFVLRGADPRKKAVGVVLHGWCGHGLGVLQAFAHAAADAGQFLALQGDHQCGSGPLRGWTNDTEGLDRRIDAAFRQYQGGEPPAEVVLMGASQGVERAIALARRFPARYKRLILLSGPTAQPPAGLSGLAGAFLLVGQNENQRPTREMAARWKNAGIAVQLRIIAHAGHADFGADADPLMREAFRFLGVE